MMKAKWIVVLVTVATLSSGCMAMKGHRSSSSAGGGGGGGGTIAEGDLMRIEEAANRAEAAANRAEAASERASMASEKAEAVFHKGLRK
ncbi:MAG TPA: alanine-zipper protein [Candidatus Limnocylindrales bacterium]|nr:alanine-zipper protein [Candidatus Limnocylindrales bacterium]